MVTLTNFIFFDIDGTLWDHEERIPKSTVHAIERLKERGCRIFLNTGRSRANLCQPSLADLGMDGLIAGCGTHIEVDGEICAEEVLPPEVLRRTIDAARQFRLPLIAEGPEYDWFNPEEFANDHYARRMWQALGNHARRLEAIRPETDKVNKCMLLITPQSRYADFESCLSEDFTFIDHRGRVAEIIPRGHSKATGIEWVCRHFGAEHNALYAVGDSSNDLDMLRYVPHSIAMGNARDVVKEACEYVTAPLDEDGIWQAMAHYGLI